MVKKEYVKWLVEFLSILAITIILSQNQCSNYWIIIPIAIMLCLKAYEYLAAVAQLYLRVKSQLALLIKVVSFEDALNVRCTYQVPVLFNKLFQTCDYMPCGGGGLRRFSRNKGIIGKSFIEKRVLVENFNNDKEYRKQMIHKYNYTKEDLKKRTADRRSYFCYPVLDENHKVHGLIYLDSSRPNTFTLDHNDSRTKNIIQICEAIRDIML